jgi:putative transposase
MTRRRSSGDLEPSSWAEFDTSALAKEHREAFVARRQAIELYVGNASVADIEQRTGVHRRQLYRMFDRCLAIHEDGRIFGWRALAPHARVASYQRTAKVGGVRPNRRNFRFWGLGRGSCLRLTEERQTAAQAADPTNSRSA